MDGFAGLDVFSHNVEDGADLRLTFLDACIHTFFEGNESFRHGGVEGNHRAGTVGNGTDGAELEAVSGECEGRGAVAVGVVHHEFRNLRDAEFHAVFSFESEEFVGGGVFDFLQEFADLFSEEAGDDGRWCFVGAETVSVGGAHDGSFEESVVAIDAHQCFHDEDDEAEVVFGCFAGTVEQCAGVGCETPVVVFS